MTATRDQAGAAGGFEVWRAEWLAARPEWRLLEVFHPVACMPAVCALEMLAQEWIDAAIAIREPEVARRKLTWWLDEVAELGAGRARHPLTCALAADPRAGELASPLVRAIGGALALLEAESIASTAGLVDAAVPLASALGEAGVALGAWGAVDGRNGSALAGALLADLVRDWPRFSRPERGLVPLALLARHDVDRAAAQSGREAAACDALLADLARELGVLIGSPHRGDLLAGRLALARAWLDAVTRDPRAAREGRLAAPRFRMLWSLWRAGRSPGGAGR